MLALFYSASPVRIGPSETGLAARAAKDVTQTLQQGLTTKIMGIADGVTGTGVCMSFEHLGAPFN